MTPVTSHMQLDHSRVEFLLEGGGSDWRTNGGDAECKAKLYASGSKGRTDSLRELASTDWFHVEA